MMEAFSRALLFSSPSTAGSPTGAPETKIDEDNRAPIWLLADQLAFIILVGGDLHKHTDMSAFRGNSSTECMQGILKQ